jgi:thiol-disulfide isomerase/thioredoxin
MKNLGNTSLIFFLTIFFFGCFLIGCDKKDQGVQGMAELNKPAPLFSLADMDGRTVNLADLKGKVVFLNFWATWCPPCREEMPSMLRLNTKMAGKPFVMLTILMNDDPAKAKNFFKTIVGGSLPTLVDPEGIAAVAYGLTGVPETFIIDKQGILRKKFIGAWPWDSENAMELIRQYL